ncbi:MAG: asparagine synthase (glutamine-hydrolyzing) [Blastocatellia bacterium]|nr:asparagine synthase (glutamine-hydrolyzing) [Blastocatellia bacterium]
MCGIAGLWDFDQGMIEADLSSMTNSLAHRGPDDSGLFTSADPALGFGHRRLSIIDLSQRGRQPMRDADDTIIITFNGEIYNYREIKRDLLGRGHQFTSDTDTEVVLYAYKEWGTECVLRLRGMFAFALWDLRRRKLLLFRDRLGVKPLYYYYDGRLLLFGSELKALMAHPKFSRELNPDAVSLYLSLGFVPAPFSIFQNTRKVRPGCYVEVSADGKLDERSYWAVTDYHTTRGDDRSERQVEEELTDLLREACAYRMVSDAPVGVFLSGGVDSSLVAAVLKREAGENIRTFTVGFDDAMSDESCFARAVADRLGADHTELHCAERDAIDLAPRLCEIYDEPFSDECGIPTYLLCKAAREEVKVALSADGGDEFFCGYAHYTMLLPAWERLSGLPLALRRVGSTVLKRMGMGAVKAMEPLLVKTTNRFYPDLEAADFSDKLLKLSRVLSAPGIRAAYISSISVWPNEALKALAPGLEPCKALDVLTRDESADPSLDMMLADAQTTLPDNFLVKVDRASMAVGLEAREPLLDHKLVEYALALPGRYKYDGRTPKYILRKILRKYIPPELVSRPKHGFAVPLTDWMRSALKPLVLHTLDPARVRRRGLFSPDYVKNAVDSFMAGDRVSAKKMWNLLQFELWRERWIEI